MSDANPVLRFIAQVETCLAKGLSLQVAVISVRRYDPALALAAIERVGTWPSSDPILRELQRSWP